MKRCTCSDVQKTHHTLKCTCYWCVDIFVFNLPSSLLCLCPLQALNKKEHRGCDSPDNDASYVLTPSTEEKYKKINEEFDHMMKSHKIVSCILVSDSQFLFAVTFQVQQLKTLLTQITAMLIKALKTVSHQLFLLTYSLQGLELNIFQSYICFIFLQRC